MKPEPGCHPPQQPWCDACRPELYADRTREAKAKQVEYARMVGKRERERNGLLR